MTATHHFNTAAYSAAPDATEKALQLKRAILKKNTLAVRRLLQEGACPNRAVDEEGNTALTTAIVQQDHAIAATLLHWGAKAETTRNSGENGLHLAARNNDVEMMALLLSSGPVDMISATTTSYKQTPLHVAAIAGSCQAVEWLLAMGAQPQQKDRRSRTPLDLAVPTEMPAEDTTKMIRHLVEAGAALNVVSRHATPLHIAVHYQNLPATQELIRLGADTQMRDNQNRTPLHIAAWHGDLETLRFLTKEVPQETTAAKAQELADALHDAVFYEHNDIVQFLLEETEVDVNKPHSQGEHSLVTALGTKNAQTVDLLLAHGANPLLNESADTSILDHARKYGLGELAEKLQSAVDALAPPQKTAAKGGPAL